MKSLTGTIAFGFIVALILFSPVLLVLGVLFVGGLVTAVSYDLRHSACRSHRSRRRGGGRRYWSPNGR